jgi:hypothetical protein
MSQLTQVALLVVLSVSLAIPVLSALVRWCTSSITGNCLLMTCW